jgi:hypothetical protein
MLTQRIRRGHDTFDQRYRTRIPNVILVSDFEEGLDQSEFTK